MLQQNYITLSNEYDPDDLSTGKSEEWVEQRFDLITDHINKAVNRIILVNQDRW